MQCTTGEVLRRLDLRLSRDRRGLRRHLRLSPRRSSLDLRHRSRLRPRWGLNLHRRRFGLHRSPQAQESRLDLRRRHLVRQMYRRRRRVRRCSAAPDGAQAIGYM